MTGHKSKHDYFRHNKTIHTLISYCTLKFIATVVCEVCLSVCGRARNRFALGVMLHSSRVAKFLDSAFCGYKQ